MFRVKVPASFTAKDELVWTLTTNGVTEKAYASLREDYKVDDVVKASETGALGAGSSSPEIRANKPPVVKVDGPKTLTAKVGSAASTIVTTVTDDGVPKRRDPTFRVRRGRAQRRRGGQTGSTARPRRPRCQRATAPPDRAVPQRGDAAAHSRHRWQERRPAPVVVRHTAAPANAPVTFDPIQIKAWEDTRAGANSPWAPIWVPPTMPADGKVTVQATFSQPGTYVLRALADDGALTGYDEVTVTVTK